ncbi:WXG100 family type VII secretion target [Streptomyces luteolus]|uniref:WXG100 family type VII secretion target n=1 Tax=Streptomyces luteolus TaxID=3043615 RepID=A0ABT6T8Q5_9ACTN|nr:WXG100 family type VII secretion target [Streptomyces sp. B-S-A12]MDI3423760.1 WXG100 family type VII secretion target [Streptomyces sp. B-S-A12]
MSGSESAAEEIIELGIEVWNPGGRPDELREAAKAWRKLAENLRELVKALDGNVNDTVGDTWRGLAANAFQKHWKEFSDAVLAATDDFEEAAKGLDEAAKNIDEINAEVHDIYLEIGISAAVSAGMSVFTLGISAAVGTARVTMLVDRALNAIGILGRALRRIAQAFRTLHAAGGWRKVAVEGLANWAGGSIGGMITSQLSGKGWEVGTNLTGGFAGATVGTAAGKAATALGRGAILSGVAGGAAGGFTGDALDSARKQIMPDDKKDKTGKYAEDFDIRQAGVTAVTGGAAGGVGGAGRSVDRGLDDFARDLRSENDYTNVGRRPEHQNSAIDTGWGSSLPVAGGVAANDAKDEVGDVDKSEAAAESAAKRNSDSLSTPAVDKIKQDFG